jgi:hypothetical protein
VPPCYVSTTMGRHARSALRATCADRAFAPRSGCDMVHGSMTAPPDLPDDVRRFVLTSVPSVPYLEALLLLHRTPETPRTAAELARALYLPDAAGAELAAALLRAGFAADAGAGAVRYAPRDDTLATMADRLALHYAADLIGVTALIHDSVRRSAQHFADAFKLRKDRP